MAESRLVEWITWLITEKKLLAVFLGPPCTTFSIMRRPRLRSRQQPYGFDTKDNGTILGNTLALRSMQTLHVAAQNDTAGIIETPHSSYMKCLPPWQALKAHDEVDEVRCDSCRFGSPHRKSFRFLGLRVDLSPLSLKCVCEEKHVQVQGSYTKGSATYTDELAKALAMTLKDAILERRRMISDQRDLPTKGLECQLSNEVMQTSEWRVLASWSFRKQSHINILAGASLLRLCTVQQHCPNWPAS